MGTAHCSRKSQKPVLEHALQAARFCKKAGISRATSTKSLDETDAIAGGSGPSDLSDSWLLRMFLFVAP